MLKRLSSSARSLQRGESVMMGMLASRRSIPRVLVRRTARLTIKSSCEHGRVALEKDISAKGIFFYSDFRPTVGEQLHFVVEFLSGSDKLRLHLHGAVVRVEQDAPGSLPGVAVLFHSHQDGKP